MTMQFNDSTLTDRRRHSRHRLHVVPATPSQSVAPEATGPSDARDALASFDSVYTAPFGFMLSVLVNGAPRGVPLVLDDETELNAVGRALDLIGADGGFEASVQRTWHAEARIRLNGTRASASAAASVRAMEAELMQLAIGALPAQLGLPQPLALELLPSAEEELSLRLHVEAAQGDGLANALYEAARAIAPALSRLCEARPSVRVTCKPIERVRVRCQVDVERLLGAVLATASAGHAARSAEHAIYRATAALGAAAHNPAVAAAHNSMIESGIAAVALAFGNAPARVIAGVKRHAARRGGCEPLCTWRAVGDAVRGELELPLDITTHGRWRAPHDAPGDAADRSATLDVGMLAACIGMAASVVALEDAVRLRVREERGSLRTPRAEGPLDAGPIPTFKTLDVR